MPNRLDIQIRDPFVLPLQEEGRYVLYGTTDTDAWNGPGVGFDAYRSAGNSLEEWEGPIPVFRPAPDFWAKENFWAPEVHLYRGRYYMFASFKSPGISRGTQILVADTPLGPFVPHSEGPVTPRGWECLDGTLYVEENGNPWMVFCHEWLQTGDGEICALPLRNDLTAANGQPIVLFTASEAPWASGFSYEEIDEAYVTDGPFVQNMHDGSLLMLWSTMGESGYCMGMAKSPRGTILGPWEQVVMPLFSQNGGHGMLFRDLDGVLRVTLHQPNDTPNERPHFLLVEEIDGILVLKNN